MFEICQHFVGGRWNWCGPYFCREAAVADAKARLAALAAIIEIEVWEQISGTWTRLETIGRHGTTIHGGRQLVPMPGRTYCEWCPSVDGSGCCVCGNDLPVLVEA